MERVLVVWCPRILQEHEHGREARAFAHVVRSLEGFAARVDPVRPGVCAVPTRGPSRYFGGDEALGRLATQATAGEHAGVGVADGVFAAMLAARRAFHGDPVIVPPGDTPAFLSPWPVSSLDRPEFTDLLVRLGVRTLGRFAALPGPEVLARFGTEGALCQRVARGVDGELPGFRLFFSGAFPPRHRASSGRQAGFWGDTADADALAALAAGRVQELLDHEAVLRGRLQGGRGPAQRARLVPWPRPVRGTTDGGDRRDSPRGHGKDKTDEGGPWPGQVPPPAPAVVLDRPLPAVLADAAGHVVGVTAGGVATAPPARLSVDGGIWTEVTDWAGPWPADERWWSTGSRRRTARLQVVTAGGPAHLLARERGDWWVEGTYD